MLLNKMELNKNVMLGIVIGVITLIFLQVLIPNITTPKVEIVEKVEYTSFPSKEHYKIDNLDDVVIIGKYSSFGSDYFIVYNKAKNKGESRLIEKYNAWEEKELGDKFEKGDEER